MTSGPSGTERPLIYDQFASPSRTPSAKTKPSNCMRPITANLNPWTEAKVETNPDRGPPLIISGGEGQHRALADRQRLLQAAARQ
jgi:hypothetical protein